MEKLNEIDVHLEEVDLAVKANRKIRSKIINGVMHYKCSKDLQFHTLDKFAKSKRSRPSWCKKCCAKAERDLRLARKMAIPNYVFRRKGKKPQIRKTCSEVQWLNAQLEESLAKNKEKEKAL